MNRKALDEKRVDLQAQMSSILETAKAEKRALTSAEENEFTKCENEIKNPLIAMIIFCHVLSSLFSTK